MIALALVVALLSRQDGFDFSRVDRTIKSEPKYDNTPKYALLLLGSEGKVRLWMALDKVVGDDVVYIDRDGDGQLGEDGERFVAAKDEWNNVVARIGKIEFPAEKLTLEDVRVQTQSPHVARPSLDVSFRLNGKVSVYAGQSAEWAAAPEKAPILHADPFGLLSFLYTGEKEMALGEEGKVTLNVGTPGWGPSTFSVVDESFLDLEKDKLLATIIAKDANGKEVKERFRLKEHC
jgi:hypothetical protein